jgi:hypothetical protein
MTTKIKPTASSTVTATIAHGEEPRYKIKSPTRGGARAGAGRPKGSTNKITMDNILQNLDHQLGHSYAEQIAMNYMSAIQRGDHAGVRDYDRVLLGKVVADKQEITTVESEDAAVAKAAAFAEALRSLGK